MHEPGSADQELDQRALPALRPDLRLIEAGEADAEGHQRRWKIHDPLAQRFFEVDQDAVDLLSCWRPGTVGELRTRAAGRFGREFGARDVLALVDFVTLHELVQTTGHATYARVRQRSDQAKDVSPWHRLLHGYLYVRLPLARPDRFLRRTLPLVGFFFKPWFWALMGLAALGSLVLVSRQWESFLATVPQMFSVAGMAAFGISLALVKTLHELGHGYCAVRMGSRISTMGVAFIVMMPVLYTDTTDAWRLRSHRQRVLIDAAGMLVELSVAVLATWAWIFLPDGPLRHAAFALATTGWVLSLLVNLNPLMRFDGYYLFSDLMNVPNLQERSFAMGRWSLRELLFGHGDAAPETLSAGRRRFFIGFAFATWIYRFFLFLGIALLVYHFFFKALGIFLFVVEIAWFIALPIWRELKVWWRRRHDGGARVRVTALVAIALLAAFVLPLPYKVRIPAVLSAAQQVPSFAPRPARIEAVLVQPGERVSASQELLRLSAPELDQQLDNAQDRARLLQERLARRASDSKDLDQSLVLARELRLERDRIDGLQRERARLVLRAPIDGVVMELARELHPGRWIDAHTRLVLIGQPATLEARGYIESEELERIAEGASGRFVDEARLAPAYPVQVQRVAAAAAESLDQWLLASVHGGSVASRMEDRQRVHPEQAVFEVSAAVTEAGDAPPPTEIRGELQIRGSAQSLALRVFERIAHVLVREGGA